MTEKKKYDSTVARIAGNILSGVFTEPDLQLIGTSPPCRSSTVAGAVAVARAIVAETIRTEPEPKP